MLIFLIALCFYFVIGQIITFCYWFFNKEEGDEVYSNSDSYLASSVGWPFVYTLLLIIYIYEKFIVNIEFKRIKELREKYHKK